MSEISGLSPVEKYVVIDDDASTLFLCKVIIQRTFKNMEVVSYDDPQNAVNYFETEFVQKPVEVVVVLDINMPDLSGWDVLDILANLPDNVRKQITVIMLSSSIDPKDKQRSSQHSLVLGYLEKPLTIGRLEEIMGKMKSAMK